MTLDRAFATRTHIPLLFLSTFDCPADSKQMQFYARKLPSDIGRWSSTLPFHVTQGALSANTLTNREIGEQFQADYILTGDLQLLDERNPRVCCHIGSQRTPPIVGTNLPV